MVSSHNVDDREEHVYGDNIGPEDPFMGSDHVTVIKHNVIE